MPMTIDVSEAMREISLQLLRSSQPGVPGGETAAGTWLGTVTLVSPRLVIAPAGLLDWNSEPVAMWVRRSGGDVSAVIPGGRTDTAFTLIDLEDDLPISAGEEVLRSTAEVHPMAEWESAHAAPEAPDRLQVAHGTCGAPVTVEGREYLSLMVDEQHESTDRFPGAPVIAGGRVVGVLALTPAGGKIWHALPLSPDMIQGWRQQQPLRKSPPAPAGAGTPEYRAQDFFKALSPSSRQALEHADGMRNRKQQDRIHMEHLVMGLYLKEDGPAERLFRSSGIPSSRELRKVLSDAVELDLPEPADYELRPLTELPPVSSHVEAAFREAQAIAQGRGSKQIQSRHLLYGTLSVTDCSVVQALLGRNIRREAIALDDEPQPDRDPLAIVSSTSDTPGGQDLLGIEHEVDALSALIASKDTKTPISIGLFGDWGSGKSFFMQKMDERIRQFREGARANSSLPFCPNIVQLWFNAWHYIDRSLWASLGAEIFEGLAHSLAEKDPRQGRQRLEEARTLLVAERALVEHEHRDAQQEALKSSAALREQEMAVRAIESRTDREIERRLGTKATLEEIVRSVTQQPEIKKRLNEARQRAGLSELAASTNQLREQVEGMVGMASYWKTVLTMARSKTAAKWWLAGAAVAGVVLLFQAQLFETVLGLEGPIRRTAARLVATGGLLAPFLAVAGRVTAIVRDSNQRMAERIKAQRLAELTTAGVSHLAAEHKAKIDAERVGQLQQQLDSIDRRIDQLKPVRQLTEFIRARHQSDEYTKHFGVIARARQDFEELTRLMELVQGEPALSTGTDRSEPFRSIDRIVLYIDDLDRCPEAKVFQVLQAVHLLLAFPLFVVVVGVDPRWLLHSLRSQLGAFSDQPDQEVDGDEERLHWQSTPLNYLEKIFQIPFTVRPMQQSGYTRLIQELTQPEKAVPRVPVPPPVEGLNATAPGPTPSAGAARIVENDDKTPGGGGAASGVADVRETTGPSQGPTQNQAPAASDEKTQKEAALVHQRLQLEEWERERMQQLFPLIPSPRASKRFVNVYRLIRAIATGPDRRELIGNHDEGGYCSVLLLLAMVTGYPAEATALIARLLGRDGSPPPSGNWWEFVKGFKNEIGQLRQSGHPTTNGVSSSGTADDGPARWNRFFEKLDEVQGGMDEEFSCATVSRWAPIVARYSFASGRLLLTAE